MNKRGIAMALAVLAVTITLFIGFGTCAKLNQGSNTPPLNGEPPIPPPLSLPEDLQEGVIVESEGWVYFPEAVELAEWLFDNIGGLDNSTATDMWDENVLEYKITRLTDSKIHVVLSIGDVHNVTTFEIEKISDGVYREYTYESGETITYKDTID